jgi:hypothetical protein
VAIVASRDLHEIAPAFDQFAAGGDGAGTGFAACALAEPMAIGPIKPRVATNDAAISVRVLVMLSPSGYQCLHGTSSLKFS